MQIGGMKLADWLTQNGKSLEWLAEQVGRDASVMSKLSSGTIRPSNEVAARIEILTDRKVTAIDHEAAYRARAGLDPLPEPQREVAA